MIIKNASIYTENHTFVNGNAVVENGRFVSFSDFSEQDAQIVDAQGLYMIPGLVDIHFHGCMGADMCDGTKEALDIITKYEASIGVTSVCPATMTIAKDELLNVMKNAGDYTCNGGAHLVGINMEGPFISASKKGAQAEENILHCDYEYFCRLQKAAKGLIKLVDLAPEEPGAMEFIEKAKDEVVISLAHTAFLAPVLYVIYAALYGIFTMITVALGFRAGFSFSAGAMDLFFSASLPAAAKIWLIIPLGIAAFLVFYFVFLFAIKKFDLKTPGREDDDDLEAEKNVELASDDFTAIAAKILEGCGGKENIASIDNCVTRLRLEVKDMTAVNDKVIKSAGVAGVIRPGKTSVQVIVGTKVQFVADAFSRLCE